MLLRLVFAALAGLLFVGCVGDPLAERKGGIFAEHASPNGVYKVSLSGRPQPVPGGMLGSGVHVIRASVTKDGAVMVRPHEIHYADSMDDSFNQDYCGADWPLENILRFHSCHPVPGAQHRTSDVLLITNAASQAIRFLAVSTSADMVLLFDLEPKRYVRVPITGRTDGNWFRVRGVWADGQELPTAIPGFRELPPRSEFEIIVRPKLVEVVRRE